MKCRLVLRDGDEVFGLQFVPLRMAEDDKQREHGDRVYHRPISEFEFLEWKHKKEADASARRTEAARKRAQDIAAGAVQMNGRELFLHEPWVFDNTLY